MAVKFTNNAATTLAAGINSSATSISVTDGSVFPSLSSGEHFYCTFDDTTNTEIVKVTARSGNTLTVVRGQDDTTARAFSSGDKAELRVVAALLEDVKTEVTSTLSVDTFTGDGTTTAFTLSQAPSSEDNLIVFIEGVYQNPGDFTLSGTTLTLDVAPANTRKIVAYHVSGAVSGNNLNHDQFTADGSTAAFTLSIAPIHENNTQVFIDGVYQQKDSYAVSGTTLTLDANPANGAKVEVMTFTQTDVNTIPASFVAGLTEVAAVGSDHLLVYDATDGALKKALASDLIETVGATPTFSTANITNTTTGDSLLFTTTEDSSTAAPVITLKRNSSSPADADYLGQLKFKGENDADQEVVYAKITSKIQDASDGSEDGLLEFANIKAGSQTITARLKSDKLQLLNSTGLEVAGLTYPTSDGTNGQALVTDGSGNLSFSTISAGVAGISTSADATAITINSSEQVGIGSTSPNARLVVSDSGDSPVRFISSGQATNYFELANTGGSAMVFSNNNDLVFGTSNSPTERMRIDGTSGNVAIGTSSTDIESLGANYKQLTISSPTTLYPGMITFQTPSSASGSAEIARVHYLNGTNRAAQFLVKPDGAANSAYMAWFTMNAGTLSERMRIDKEGFIGMGTSTPSSYNSYGDNLVVASSTHTGVTIAAGTSSQSTLMFADGTGGTAAYRGRVGYAHSGDYMEFHTAAGQRMIILSDGKVIIRPHNTTTETADGGYLQLTSPNDLYSMYVSNTGFASVGSVKGVERGATSAYSFAQWYSGRRPDTGGGDREFNFRGDGNAYADGSFNNSGADYAEYFESHTGSAIPRGTTVVLENNKVRAATSEDDVADIIGVVRPKEFGKNSMVVGNTAWNMWSEKYLTDDFNCYVMEDYSVVSWNDEDGELVTYESDNIPSDVTVPDDAETNTHDENGVKFQRRALNPDFDASRAYEPREERDEWVIVGLIGQVQILDGQPTNDRWIKMRDISDTVEEWYIR